LGVLVIALIAGTLLFSQGTGVFAPRATPQTTPKKIRVSNLTDSSFTVSFLTDEATVGNIKYGTEAKNIDSQSSDDRDQLSGTVGQYNVHHVTVRGLEPNSTYYYNLGTTSGVFDNNGQPFTIQTAQRSGVPSAAKTIYGSVVSPSGSPAEGVVIYVKAEGVGEMSSLVKSSGSWAIPLSNARLADGSTYAQITDDDTLTLFVQGTSLSLTSEVTTTTANAQPVDNITLGQSQNLADKGVVAPIAAGVVPDLTEPTEAPPEDLPVVIEEATDSADQVSDSSLDDLLEVSPIDETTESSSSTAVTTIAALVDLEAIEEASSSPTINTTQPTITGKAAPNVTISIQVHSDTQIDQYIVADSDGNFELDIAKLEQELEPGEHTVTYSYDDPVTGETVTKTETFYVSETATQLAQADTTTDDDEASSESTQDYPYSSSNPYPIEEATDSGRIAQPSTESALPVSGSVGTTYALIFGGLFFILAGVWSWWIANNLEEELVV